MFLRKSVIAAAAIGFSVAGPVAQPALAAPGAPPADTNGPVRIVSDSGGQRMSIYDASSAPGAQLVADASNAWYSRKTEVWVISSDPGGYYVIKNNASGLCLQPTDPNAPAIGMNVVQQPCDGSGGQKWRLNDYSAASMDWSASKHEYMITPSKNPNAAIAITDWGNNNWSTVTLDHSYAASNRLWMLYRE